MQMRWWLTLVVEYVFIVAGLCALVISVLGWSTYSVVYVFIVPGV
jgi:cytochrome c oxidase subunit IV